MEVSKVEPGTVPPGEESRPRVKNIYLRGHCVFCLRRLKDVEITRDGRTFESETGNLTEVPAAELPQNAVSTVNWVWDALKMEQEKDGDIFGVRSGPGVGTKFNGVPKLCQMCGAKVLGVDKLFSWVRREIIELRRLLTWCKEQGSCRQFVRTLYNLGLDDGVVADTMEFLGEFRNRIGIDGVQKDDESIQGDGVEDVEDEKKECVSCEVTSSSMAKDPEFLGEFRSRIEPEVEPEQEVVSSEEDEDPSIPFIPCTSESVKTHDPLAIDDSSTDEFEDGTSAEDDDDKDEDYIPSKKKAKFDKRTKTIPLRGQQQQKKPSPKQRNLSTNQVQDALQEEFYVKEEEEGYSESEDESSAPNSPECKRDHSKQPKKTNKELQKKVRISKFHKDIICEFCKIKIPQIELHEHIKGHVGQEYIDMVRCPDPQCWFACVTQNQLYRHFKKRALCIKNVVGGLQAFKKKQRTCTVCEFTGNSLTILNNHLLQVHETPEKNFPCPISGCGMKFTVKQSVVLHLGQHDVQRQVESQPCLQCENNSGRHGDKKQIKLEEMEAHLKEVHGAEQVVSCVKCPFLFSSRERLVEHIFQHRFGELLCDICLEAGGRFSAHIKLVEHYFKEHQIGSKKFQCGQCPAAFWKQYTLWGHIKKSHNNKDVQKSKPTFTCENCAMIFKTRVTFIHHRIKIHGDTPLSCKYCSQTFTNCNAVTEHENVVHKGVKAKEFVCQEPDCGRVFKLKETLEAHLKFVHLGEKANVCGQCEKAFETDSIKSGKRIFL